jgi:hypothetical protein
MQVKELSPVRVRAAWIVALAADAIQVGGLPIFAEGALSPWNDVLDVIVAAAMVALLGWHWAFIPTLVAESLPLVDLIPSWTAAVLFVTRGSGMPIPAGAPLLPGIEGAKDVTPRAAIAPPKDESHS